LKQQVNLIGESFPVLHYGPAIDFWTPDSQFHCPGLAKPGPVIETFCSDELVSKYVKLDGVVTMVDCKHAMKHLNEVKARWVVNEAVEQVAYADRIILNKVFIVVYRRFKRVNTISYWLHLFLHFSGFRTELSETSLAILIFCNFHNTD
jgi:hypothetical protein